MLTYYQKLFSAILLALSSQSIIGMQAEKQTEPVVSNSAAIASEATQQRATQTDPFLEALFGACISKEDFINLINAVVDKESQRKLLCAEHANRASLPGLTTKYEEIPHSDGNWGRTAEAAMKTIADLAAHNHEGAADINAALERKASSQWKKQAKLELNDPRTFLANNHRWLVAVIYSGLCSLMIYFLVRSTQAQL